MTNESLVTIANRTGFSVSTVSRVLSGQAEKYRISRHTTEIIEEEARRCNYIPSLLAKGLRLSRTNTIGLLVPGIDNPYFADITCAIIREARRNDFTVIVIDTTGDEAAERDGVVTLLKYMVDGIIVVPCGNDPFFLEEICRKSRPVVLLDRYFENSALSYVTTDNYRGAKEATFMLIDNGHRSVACIGGIPYSMPCRRRRDGFYDAVFQCGSVCEATFGGDDFSVENGYVQMKKFLACACPPTGVFTMSNTLALGALKAIREAELKVPEDISIVSFDDSMYLDFLSPAVTRIGQPTEAMGREAVRILLKAVMSGEYERTCLELAPAVISRDSVRDLDR